MKKQLNFRIEEELLAAFDEKCAGTDRTAVIIQLMQDFVGADAPSAGLDAKDKAVIYDGEVKISKLVNTLALKALQARGDRVFGKLTDSELAKLVISQLPKPKDVDADLEKDMLSLKNALAKLPAIDDITGELSRVKFALNRLTHEREVQQAVIGSLRKRLNADSPGAWDEFARAVELAMAKSRELATEAEARQLDLEPFKPLVLPK